MVDLGFVKFEGTTFTLRNPLNWDEVLVEWDPVAEVNSWKSKVDGWMTSLSTVLSEALGAFFGGIKNFFTDVLFKAPGTVFSAVGGGIKKAFGKNEDGEA